MKDKDTYDYFDCLEHREIPMLKEELAPYLAHRKQGEYTIEDYYNLPDEHRVELIDGVIYDMSSPSSIHQIISLQLCIRFDQYIKNHKGNCIPFLAPMDVQLDSNDKTIVQPDILIICDKSKIKDNLIYGAPDLVIEVLSPSTQNKDIKIKTTKYRKAGVKEYWIINPLIKQICVHEFLPNNNTTLYSFEDKIPVGIWEGKCVVDFKEIYEYLRFLDVEDDVDTDE